MSKLTKPEGVARITEWLVRGHHLTSKDVVERFAAHEISIEVARAWLKTVEKALGDHVVCKRIEGATWQYAYCAETTTTRGHLESAAIGLQLAKGALEPLAGAGVLSALRAAQDALAARLDDAARNRVSKAHASLIRPRRPLARPDGCSVIEAIIAAIRRSRVMAFDYQRSDGTSASYVVHPWALIDHADGLYLFCTKASAPDQLRTFDVHGIQAVRETGAEFVRPGDVQARFEDYRHGYFGIFIDAEASPEWIEIGVKGYACILLERRPLAAGQIITPPPQTGGWSRLKVYVAVTPELVGRLLMLGSFVKVYAPRSLEHRHLAALTAARRNYGIGPTSPG